MTAQHSRSVEQSSLQQSHCPLQDITHCGAKTIQSINICNQ